jgi:hypothetical protein
MNMRIGDMPICNMPSMLLTWINVTRLIIKQSYDWSNIRNLNRITLDSTSDLFRNNYVLPHGIRYGVPGGGKRNCTKT